MVIHILGAGIAGLTIAGALDRRGRAWRLYEKSAAVGAEASGKNAGIVRTYEVDPVIRHFTMPSLEYYRRSEPSYTERGLILRPWDIDYTEKPASQREFSHGRFRGLFLPQNGTLEPMQLLANLAGQKFQHGTIHYNMSVQLSANDDRIYSTTFALAEDDILVAACGEGALALCGRLGRNLGLVAHRRTLYEFRNALGSDGPVEWDEESGVYFRPYGKNFLATAGEQVPAAQATVNGEVADDKMLAVLEREMPFLNRENLLSTRTCKRLTPLDNRPVIGRDPHFTNLFWFTGLGGRGISTAPALAEALAGFICGEDYAQNLDAFSPGRMSA